MSRYYCTAMSWYIISNCKIQLRRILVKCSKLKDWETVSCVAKFFELYWSKIIRNVASSRGEQRGAVFGKTKLVWS